MELKHFYEQEAGELNTDAKPASLPSHGFRVANSQSDPVRRLMQLSREHKRVDDDRKELEHLLTVAKGDDADAKDSAIGRIIEKFGKVAKKLKVFFSEPITDSQGNAVGKVAMKVITSDAQLEKLKQHVEVAKMYFPELEFLVTKDVKNRDVAIVIGVDAIEFNAVIAAEKAKKAMEDRIARLDDDMKKAQADLEANVAKGKPDTAAAKETQKKAARTEEPALG